MSALFGGGLGSFLNFIRASEKGMYPHNFILESLAEGGVIAGVLLMWCASKLKFSLYQEEISGSISGAYICALAIYSVMAFRLMGGISGFWQPMLFVVILIYSKSVGVQYAKNKLT